jgi:hypothetical protein
MAGLVMGVAKTRRFADYFVYDARVGGRVCAADVTQLTPIKYQF